MLRLLYQLQLLDAEEKALRAAQTESEEYQNLKRIKSEFEQKKEQLRTSAMERKTAEDKLHSLQNRFSEFKDRIAKENAAVYDGSVTNAKELAAREAQIANIEEKLQLLQNQQNALNVAIETAVEKISSLRQDMADQSEKFNATRAIYLQKCDQWNQNINNINDSKKEITAQIEQSWLDWFNANYQKFDGSPVAMLKEDHVCSGCHIIVPPITYKRTVLGKNTRCDKCGRLLFVE